VLVLPPRAALRRVEVAGRVGRVGHLRLPPAAEQCGYFDLGTLDQRRR
jgi:hypothetical protein